MTTQPQVKNLDPAEQQRLLRLSTRASQLLSHSFARQLEEMFGNDFTMIDGHAVARSFQDFGMKLLSDPARMMEANTQLWRDSFTLWQRFLEGAPSGRLQPLVEAPKTDRRFKDPGWSENPGFAMLQQSYLVFANWLQELVDEAEGLDPQAHQRVKFFTRQYLNAIAPSNYPLTNPQVLKQAQDTGGKSLLDGLEHFLDDLERGGGHLRIQMTNESAFGLGKNLALTPGKVVYKNELMELIQYSPTTEQVHARPLLVIPAWINKFYILDLQPKNSFVKWAVDQGFTVFLISWANPTKELAHKRFQDYLGDGVLAALDAIEQQTGMREVSALGFCIGGILLATGLAHMAAKGDDRIKAATFFATLFDFEEDVGELGMFVDVNHLDAMEEHTAKTGFLEGRHMANTFSMLRENDLVWSFVVNNYLLGREPAAFDLLYWNADSTRLPARMLSDYARGFYLQNALARPGTLEVLGTPIDTTKVTTPSYAVATREDHLAPWHACFPIKRQFRGPVRFCLGGSGHIAGIMNPASSHKYGYWINDAPAADPESWFENTTFHEGSWWPDWAAWLAEHSGEKVAARDPERGELTPLYDAPGRYVQDRSDDG
jgi:polyhydroxyalkanoate synthase subunit PhaC